MVICQLDIISRIVNPHVCSVGLLYTYALNYLGIIYYYFYYYYYYLS